MSLTSLENNNRNGLKIGFIFMQAWNIGKIMLESGFIFTQAWNVGKLCLRVVSFLHKLET